VGVLIDVANSGGPKGPPQPPIPETELWKRLGVEVE